MTIEDNIAVVCRLMETLSNREWEGFEALIAEDCEWTSVPMDLTRRGPKELVAGYRKFTEAFPDFFVEAITLIGQGDIVANEWSARGTHDGPLVRAGRTHAPTGRPFARTGVGIVEVRNGQITRYRDYFDRQTMAEQLGLD